MSNGRMNKGRMNIRPYTHIYMLVTFVLVNRWIYRYILRALRAYINKCERKFVCACVYVYLSVCLYATRYVRMSSVYM